MTARRPPEADAGVDAAEPEPRAALPLPVPPPLPPPEGTVERWAWDYVLAPSVAAKLALDPPPVAWEEPRPAPRRDVRPLRPPPLVVRDRGLKTPGDGALRDPVQRARLVHTFLHHEVQAAELLCWAVLAFPDAPEAFRAGLAAIARDEARHVELYRAHLATLGFAYGGFPVRDWFWERVPRCPTPAHFVATLGVGFEGANLDHAARFAARFDAAGDAAAAALQRRVAREEVAHVRFAIRWFARFTGRDDFEAWAAHLAPPLSPLVMHGEPVQRDARVRAGLSPAFVKELEQWAAAARGS